MSILTALPEIAPTVRDFTMDLWPQRNIKTRSGITMRQALVNAPAGAELELAWENITSDEAEALFESWDDSYGMYGDLELDPDTILGLTVLIGANVGIGNLVLQPFPNATWRFVGPPEVELVKRNRCTVRLRLRTRRNITGSMEP
jgi:hypothetical protein